MGSVSSEKVSDVKRDHVLLFCYHAYPDSEVGARRTSELANYLVNVGWRVTIVSGSFAQNSDSEALESRVRAIRVEKKATLYAAFFQRFVPSFLRSSRKLQMQNANVVAKTLSRPDSYVQTSIQWASSHFHHFVDAVDNFKRWSVTAVRTVRAEILRDPPRVLVCSCPPFSPAVVAALLCRRYSIPLILDLRDPWSDLPEFGFGKVHAWSQWLDRACEKLTVSAASVVVTTTPRYCKRLHSRYKMLPRTNFMCIRNGFDERQCVEEPSPTGILSLLFAGTIYFNRDPIPLFRAIGILLSDPSVCREKVRFNLVGKTRYFGDLDLVAWVDLNGLRDVIKFVEPTGQAGVRQLTVGANVLVNLSQGQPEQVPAKVYEQLATGRYMLVICEEDSESADLLAGHPLVVRVNSHAEELSAVLRRLYWQCVNHGVPQYENEAMFQFSRMRMNAEYSGLLNRFGGR